MAELDIQEKPSVLAPELIQGERFVVRLKGGNKSLDVRFVPNIDAIGTYIYGFKSKRAIPGMTTRLYSRAYEIMQVVVTLYGRDFRYAFQSRNPHMMAWARDPDRGAGIFQWDDITLDTPEKFGAAKIIHPWFASGGK